MNAIFHYGLGIEQVYNISMCREERSWIEIDEQIKKSNSLEMLKIFIYYFYKKVLTKICIKQHIMKYIWKFYIKVSSNVLITSEIYIYKFS